MIIRIYALYGRSTLILGFLVVMWIIQVTLSSMALLDSFREFLSVSLCAVFFLIIMAHVAVTLPPGLVGMKTQPFESARANYHIYHTNRLHPDWEKQTIS